jgi:hypothetical protein
MRRSASFLFMVLSTTALFFLWYWIIFGNGAKNWEKEILRIHGNEYRLIAKPIVAKIASTLLLFGFLFGFVLMLFNENF